MKQKFKVGDKVTPTNVEDYYFGKTGEITNLKNFNGSIEVDFNHDYNGNYDEDGLKLIESRVPTLTIKKLTRTRKGDEYFTWQFSVKGKVSNHNFNSPQSRDKSLTMFIKYIQDGDFKIVKG